MRPGPLPPALPAAFTIGRAHALGVSEGRLRASDLRQPFRGSRARRDLSDVERARLLLDVLPRHAFLCGFTGAVLWGLPLPWHAERTAAETLEIGVSSVHTRIRRVGTRGRRLHVIDGDVLLGSGIRILSPARLWVDVAERLDLPDLVALTDRLIARRNPLTTHEELAHAHERFLGSRGSPKRIEALELCDEGAESPRESIVRMLLMTAGLPRPECNVDMFDGSRFVARVDMLYRAERLIIEYDGDYHRDPIQWSKDQSRRAELESLGYRVTVITRTDLDDPAALVARIRRLLAA